VTLREKLLTAPCGLHVIGSGRHESRRIDRQLRGRCARQGDPGSSRFYISLEDDLMRLFGSDRIANIMSRFGMEEGEPLEHRWLNRSIETAQRRVEQQNYSIRKRTLEYDDVMNKQREVVYGLRGEIVRSENIRDHVLDILRDEIENRAEATIGENGEDGVPQFLEWFGSTFPVPLRPAELAGKSGDVGALANDLFSRVEKAYALKVSLEEPGQIEMMERHIMLHAIDSHWQDYLRSMDSLRQGVGLRAYGQRDPLVEYKREAYDMFEELMGTINQDIASSVFRSSTSVESFESFLSSLPQTQIHEDVTLLGAGGLLAQAAAAESDVSARQTEAPKITPTRRDEDKIGRNDPCPCGSGKKYKKCHGS
ncbi:MAG: SEC-C metal-binding domain-containing protein, partial [Verrucomicrobia bacterium]|nr:SEC-C metal-binding domain-containing protein [Verrucomicrobiota bacterium]